ncbi:YqjK-like family protein [Kluyvera sp. STS39-E]|uniref:YqjK-like family protein n=1 Tax=Kluyvera sp. STS39-E TaxID=3234748 RepID=UPI0034C6B1FA
MTPRQSREERKALLLRQIQQQRLDLLASRRDWLEATEVYDRGWSKLVSLRSWVMVASSAAALVSLRHPRFLVRWARRGLGIWSTWRMARNLLR